MCGDHIGSKLRVCVDPATAVLPIGFLTVYAGNSPHGRCSCPELGGSSSSSSSSRRGITSHISSSSSSNNRRGFFESLIWVTAWWNWTHCHCTPLHLKWGNYQWCKSVARYYAQYVGKGISYIFDWSASKIFQKLPFVWFFCLCHSWIVDNNHNIAWHVKTVYISPCGNGPRSCCLSEKRNLVFQLWRIPIFDYDDFTGPI